ncbi:MAG: amidinotransferase [Lysobacterales bacterium]|nr:MAG: amidinotransferase [Xanthomonadales bacterium]
MRGMPLAVQIADTVLMVRPAAFGWNPQTCASNLYQPRTPPAGGAHERALAEFDAFARALGDAGVDVQVFEDARAPLCPDAVFPNNWVTLHADGTVVLYPMLAPNRRQERRLEMLVELERRGGFRVDRLVDLTHHELEGRCLEGTGSVVFDHVARIAYACLSPRTDAVVLQELCGELGYESCAFHACDAGGAPIYHTNVLLAVGRRHVVVCAEAVAERERQALLERLAQGGRHVERITRAQVAAFAGNTLELGARNGGGVLAVSARAWEAFGPAARERLAGLVDRVVAAPVHTIEDVGGGSVRCMLAEVFLPRAAVQP